MGGGGLGSGTSLKMGEGEMGGGLGSGTSLKMGGGLTERPLRGKQGILELK